MAGPLGNRFQTRSLMNMGGSTRDAAMRAMLERKRLEEEQAAMFAAKRALADPVVVEAFMEDSPQTSPPSRNVTPGGSGESAWLKQALQGIGDRNLPVAQRNLASGRVSAGSILDLGRSKLDALTQPQHAPTVTSINSVNAGIGQGNPRFRGPPGAPSAPVIPAGARARHHPGFDQYGYAGKPNSSSPFSSKLLADLRKPEEDEFMSYDDQMFLLALMEGSRPGQPHTPYGTAVGGGNKSWASLPFGRMA